MIHSYPTVFQIGHKAIVDIFKSPVLAEEKIDGSQFSFGVINGELECRSKGKQLILDAPEKMFEKAVATARELEPLLHPDWMYRGEYLEKPKHNALSYDRTPHKNIILFDVQTSEGETYLTRPEKVAEALRIGLECVPVLFEGEVKDFAQFKSLLETPSALGNTKIEGVVFKNYELFTLEKKVAMGKYVSESYKEIHNGEWKKMNPTSSDITDKLIYEYKTDARYHKAIQHLRDAGELTDTPKDIGAIIKEIGKDIDKECQEEIKEKLYKHFWPKIQRGVTAGLPEWYKELLAKRSF